MKLLAIIAALIIAATLDGCGGNAKASNAVKFSYVEFGFASTHTIFLVPCSDGHEYLVSSLGGVCHAEGCRLCQEQKPKVSP